MRIKKFLVNERIKLFRMSAVIRPSRIPKMNNYLLSGLAIMGASMLHAVSPLIAIVGGVLGALPALKAELWRYSKKFVIDKDELVFEEGLLSKAKTKIPLKNIVSVNVKQGIRERILNYGTVTLTTWSGSEETVPTTLFKVRRPKEIADHLNFLIKKE